MNIKLANNEDFTFTTKSGYTVTIPDSAGTLALTSQISGGGGSGSGSGGSGEQAVTSVTVSGSGNAVTNATFSNKALTLTKGNIATPGTLTTTSTTALSTASNEALSGSINLHKVAKTGTYSDLIGKPTIPAAQVQSDWNATSGMGVILNKPTIPAAPGTLKTNNTTAQTASASEALSGTINLHKVAKTGTYSDLIGTPTIPTKVSDLTNDSGFTSNSGTITGITMNGASKGTSGVVDLGTVITSHAKHKLTTTNGTATSASGTITYVESLTGTTTATDGDLTLTATRKSITIPSAPGTLNTTATTAQSTAASEALSGSITLHKVAKTGTYSDLIGTPTIPTVNNSTISIQKGGTAVDSFTTNASSAKTINIPNELPSYSSSDSGKILSVNSSGQLVWITPAQIYSGSGTPSNGTGNNGDIYLQS